MRPVYINIFYMQQIIKYPSSAGVVGSPVPMVGGWLVVPPKKGARNGH